MEFKQGWLRALTVLSAVAVSAVSLPLQAEQSLAEMIKEGKFGYSFRYRLETVDQDSFDEDATASTLRGRLNFKMGGETGLAFFVEGDYVLEVGADDYNAGGGNTPSRSQYPVVADPDGGDLNQAWIHWKSKGGTLMRAGRQRIILDNARFVGNVGWRQNEQTYDGLYVQHKAGGYDLQAAYIDQVNRIFGDDVDAGEHDNSTWLFNVSKSWKNYGKLTAYYYDIENKDAAAFSTETYGLRYSNKHSNDSFTLAYSADLAGQSDANNAPVNYSADYYRFDISFGSKAFTPYLGYEVLTGDENRAGGAFRTPLATLHAFNGWADKFIGTPDDGLEDLFVGVKGTLAGWNWNLVYHDFDAEDGDAEFGQELDASIARKFAKRYGILFKVAHFNAESNGRYDDTTKFWVQGTASF